MIHYSSSGKPKTGSSEATQGIDPQSSGVTSCG
jgi:hypothetical protein